MTKLKDLQHEVYGLLYAATSLGNNGNGVPIVEHKGSDADETAQQTALESKGCVVLATIPFDGKLVSQAAGTSGAPSVVLDVELSVLVRVDVVRNDPAQNPDGLDKDIFALIQDAVAALFSFKTANPNDSYKLAPQALTLDRYDAGVWGYEINFNKRCVL